MADVKKDPLTPTERSRRRRERLRAAKTRRVDVELGRQAQRSLDRLLAETGQTASQIVSAAVIEMERLMPRD